MTSLVDPTEMFGVLPFPALLCGRRGEVCSVTPAVLDFLGLPHSEQAVQQVLQSSRVMFSEEDRPSSVIFRSADNSEAFRVPLNARLMANDQFFCVFSEVEAGGLITEKFHSQRLQTLGMLAGGVAHDFNNMLAGILGHITYLKTILPAQGAHSESLLAIEDGARKASGLTRQILNFSKLASDERPGRVELSALLGHTTKLLRGALPPGIRLSFECDQPCEVLAVEARLAQVFVNLVINARDALGQDGNIQIRVLPISEHAELRQVFHSDELAASRYALVQVQDDGCGMPPEVIPRIFEPYFSTKGAGGTGLGLATVREIIEQIGGVIEFESAVNLGTSVKVFLPLLDPAPVHKDRKKTIHPLEGGSERILIVDDEAAVRNVMVMSLEHLGYDVMAVDNGLLAIEMLRQSDVNYDLIILDMLMPKMPGERVFAELRKINPGQRVLLISGYSSEAAVQSVLEQGGLGFVQKPFTIDELSTRVRECLGKVC